VDLKNRCSRRLESPHRSAPSRCPNSSLLSLKGRLPDDPPVPRTYRIGILSDVHFAGAGEQARGNDFESRGVANPLVRRLLRRYRRHIWLRNPLDHNHLLDDFLAGVGAVDLVVANGDYTCDSAFVGVSDDAAAQSVAECLGKLRAQFGARFHAILGDHDLGKLSLAGHLGGLRLASWRRATGELGLQPFWQVELGRTVLMGVTSSLLCLPVIEFDVLPDERAEWRALRAAHLEEIRRAFGAVAPEQRVLLFCHDPTALPFLLREDAVRSRVSQIAQTIIGHLHTPLVFWKSRRLAGMPRISFLGRSVHRFTSALNEARAWRAFNVRLCPALAGVELLKDGGYLTAEVNADAREAPRFQFHPLPRRG
jgi:predicted MPP superfamily phosphohydrolase